MTQSPFLDRSRWLAENRYAFALLDMYPVSPGHTLIVPKRAVRTVFDLQDRETAACWQLLVQQRGVLQRDLRPSPTGFNVGVNDGEVAGQTIDHAHIHLIPRYRGDHPNPRGGVRSVIPGRSSY